MIVDVSDLPEDEVVDVLESVLANKLNVHLANIDVIYDSNSGVATYTITNDNAELLTDIITDMQQDEFEIAAEGVSIESIVPSNDIIVNVDVKVNASGVDNADTIVGSVTQNLQTQNPTFTVESELQFITSAPSKAPTVRPTGIPSTSIPSATPSVTGWVASISATRTATNPISSNTIDGYIAGVAQFYGVNETDVEVATRYDITGSISVNIPEGVSENDLKGAITSSIAESLEVHPSDVEVIIDMESGAVEFTITSDDFDGAANIQFDLGNDRTQTIIVNQIENALPTVDVDAYEIDDDIIASIEIIVDANDANNDLTQAAWQSEQLLSEFDVNVNSNGKRFLILTVFVNISFS